MSSSGIDSLDSARGRSKQPCIHRVVLFVPRAAVFSTTANTRDRSLPCGSSFFSPSCCMSELGAKHTADQSYEQEWRPMQVDHVFWLTTIRSFCGSGAVRAPALHCIMCGLLVWIDDAAAHCKGGVLSFAVRCNAAANSVPFSG